MKKTLMMLAAVAAMAVAQTVVADDATDQQDRISPVAGEKLDSGLGSMVYGESLDNGLGSMVYGESLDDGLGQLSELDMRQYSDSASGAVQVVSN